MNFRPASRALLLLAALCCCSQLAGERRGGGRVQRVQYHCTCLWAGCGAVGRLALEHAHAAAGLLGVPLACRTHHTHLDTHGMWFCHPDGRSQFADRGRAWI